MILMAMVEQSDEPDIVDVAVLLYDKNGVVVGDTTPWTCHLAITL